jgi:alkyldihydroxyacetonephosphate synthase
VKTAVSDAILKYGGSITHHTSIGRDHMPWFKQQTDPLFARALGLTKTVFDPDWMMNPGVVYWRDH